MQQPIEFYEKHFHGLFESALLDELQQVGNFMEIKQGDYLMRPGGYIRFVPILLSGSIKIMRPDDDGREMLLYYLGGLDTCAMSLTCCLQQKTSEIIAVAEENTKLIAIPVEKIDEWLGKYRTWKEFIFTTYQKRFDDLLDTIDSVAFTKLDERLLKLINKKLASTGGKHILYVTHEELASELATSREVVSRLLKQLEKLDKVKLSRNKIELL
jgi:CRP/FNR family transcriptional regulator